MINTFKKSLFIVAACLAAGTLWAKDPTTVLDISTEAGTNAYYSLDALPAIKDLTWVGYNSTGSGSGGCISASHWKLSNSRTLTFKVKNCSKVEAIDSYFSKDATTNLNYAINGGSATSFATNGTLKKTCASGDFLTNNTGEITIVLSADNDVTLNEIRFYPAGATGPVAVTGVSLNKTSTSIEAGQTETLTATIAPNNADNTNVSWNSSNTAVATVDATGKVTALSPGETTITVTTEDGGQTATCAVTVTAPPTPIEVTGISIDATAMIGIGEAKTLTVTYTPADANSGKALTWSSANTSIATVDANGVVTGVAAGTVAITATSATNPAITASCSVTVQAIAVTGVSLNNSSLELQIGGNETLTATVAPSNATDKSMTWTSSNPAVATVNNGIVNALTAGTTTITVTTVDGNKTATCTVTVTAGPPVPDTNLSLHEPEVYEAKELAGGYHTPLVVFNQREYEVYYFGKSKPAGASSDIAVAFTMNHIGGTLVSKPSGSTSAISAADGWFESPVSSLEGSFKNESEIQTKAAARDEFAGLPGDIRLKNNQIFELHISGYDQFSIVAQDKKKDTKGTTPADNKYWEVYIDDVLQDQQFDKDNASTRRYTLTTGRHVIKLKAIGGEESKLYGFSLRVAQEPRTKWLKGNDSTQVVFQTNTIRPVTYATKYNNIPGAETRLEWDGPAATGITLTKITGSLSDTLTLSGQANCPVGTYHYNVVSYYNNIETTRVPGSFQVVSSIKAASVLSIDAYVNEDIEDPIIFHYYALSPEDVQLTWTQTTPAGITGVGDNGTYTISGRPTAVGTYPYSITVVGADTVLTGKVVVRELNMGNNPIMYLFKNNMAYENDPVYQYLTSAAGGNKNLVARKARKEGLRTPDQYAKYKWILISEDADADNAEVLAIVRGAVNVPVLNMKGFTYSPDRLGWGYPDNGTVDTTTHNGCNIFIQRNDHPIFSRFNLKAGDKLTVFDKIDRNGIMPIAISGEEMQNTLCLATGYTRNIEDYNQDGELQTAIHEIPAAMRGGKKYICMPMAIGAGNKLSIQGKDLLNAIVSYLLDESSATFIAPTLRIDHFSILGIDGNINDAENTITVNIDTTQITDLDLTAVQPSITLADPTYTHVTPASGETIDLQYSSFLPAKYIVSDYISSRVYYVIVRQYATQGLENVYEAGQWVNVYDIYGRKIATTNEDIYQMELPHGVYLVITENGQTIKLMR